MKKTLLIALLLSVGFPQTKMDINNLIERRGLVYAPNKEKPYSGSVFELYGNAQKKLYGRYRKGLKNGKWTEWYENGQKKDEGTWKDGEKDGLWTEWNWDGQKKNEYTYKDGELDGKWTEWYENGQKGLLNSMRYV